MDLRVPSRPTPRPLDFSGLPSPRRESRCSTSGRGITPFSAGSSQWKKSAASFSTACQNCSTPDNLVFKRHAFWVVLVEPGLCGFCGGEHLHVVPARLVDPYCHL